LSPEPPPEPSGEVDESPWFGPPSPGAALASSPTGPTLLSSPLPELLAPDPEPDDPELDAPELPRPELDGPAPELDSPPGRAPPELPPHAASTRQDASNDRETQ
jgi:hypothetical protein